MNTHANINSPEDHFFQVRITRNKISHRKCFYHYKHGGKRNALKIAIAWRDKKLVELNSPARPPLRKKKYANNKTGTIGVSKTIYFNVKAGFYAMCYTVSFKHKNNKTIKTFWLGNISNITRGMEKHALKTAIQFRKDYERSILKKTAFYPNSVIYRNWKIDNIY